MRVPVSLRLAAPIAVMASIALLPIKAHANAFVFAADQLHGWSFGSATVGCIIDFCTKYGGAQQINSL